MKKLILLAAVALCAFTTASAQEMAARTRNTVDAGTRTRTETTNATERIRWGVGPKIGIYTHTGGDGAVFGIGASARYSISSHWRLEPALIALIEDDCSLDINCDLQYLFTVARWWSLYPQVGLSGNDIYGWSFGVNLGVGTDFTLTRRWDLTAGVKWLIQTADNHDNPFIINIGAIYKF